MTLHVALAMSSLSETIELLPGLKIHSYFYVSSAALLIYEYWLTLDREVLLIWNAPWTLVKFLFILARYSPFVDITAVLYYQFNFSISPSACQAAILLAGWMHIFGIAISEAILFFRTWALWDCRRQIAIAFLGVFMAAAVCVITTEIMWMKSLTFGRVGIASIPSSRCYKLIGSSILIINFVVVIVLETIVVTMTIVKMVQQCRVSGAHGGLDGLVRVLYRDGIVFFIYMFGISLANLFFVPLGSATAKDILVDTQRILHSVFSVRVLLNLREAHHRDVGDDRSTGVSPSCSSPVIFAPLAVSPA